jgi:hypothetical protein
LILFAMWLVVSHVMSLLSTIGVGSVVAVEVR